MSRLGKPGPGQQADNAEPCQKLFQILCLHKTLLAIVYLLKPEYSWPFLSKTSMDHADFRHNNMIKETPGKSQPKKKPFPVEN